MSAAVYARVLDGDHLWLAVEARAGASLSVRGVPAGEQPVPTEHRGGLAVATVDVAGLLGDVDTDRVVLTLAVDGAPVTWEGGPAVGPTKVPPTRDGRWQLRVVSAEGELRVVRTRADAAVAVASFAQAGPDTVLLLDPGAAGVDVEDATLVALDEDREVGRVEVRAGRAVLDASLVVAEGVVARLALLTAAGAVPVVRRERDLKRAHQAVALPACPGGRLQWQPDGQLALKGGAGA